MLLLPRQSPDAEWCRAFIFVDYEDFQKKLGGAKGCRAQ